MGNKNKRNIRKKNKKSNEKSPVPKSGREHEEIQIAYRKKRLLTALREGRGNITFACTKTGIGRTTYYKYYNNDPDFRQTVWEIEEEDLDHTESKLQELVDEKEPSAIYFKLKCKGKQRGYIERQDIGIGTLTNEPQKIMIGGKEIVFK